MLNFTPSLNTGITEITEYFTHRVDKAQDQNLSQGYKPMKNLRCTCKLMNLQLWQSRRCMRKSPWRFPGTSPLNYLEPQQHLCKLEGFAWCTLKTKILSIRHFALLVLTGICNLEGKKWGIFISEFLSCVLKGQEKGLSYGTSVWTVKHAHLYRKNAEKEVFCQPEIECFKRCCQKRTMAKHLNEKLVIQNLCKQLQSCVTLYCFFLIHLV